MRIIKTTLPDLLIIQPKVYEDQRGYFFESYSFNVFEANGIKYDFVQDNESLSQKDVLRGLHFQNPPFAQAKLVRVIKGAVLDVVVDIRKDSPAYGRHYKTELTESNKTMLLIPEGFAHGFLTLKDNTIFSYKCSTIYNKSSEMTLQWNDPDLNISWGITHPVLSGKDSNAQTFKSFNSMF